MLNLLILLMSMLLGAIFLPQSSKEIILTYHNVNLRIPVFLGIISLIILGFIFFSLIRLSVKFWWSQHCLLKDIRATKKSCFALMSGDFITAEKVALSISRDFPFGWIGFLVASSASKQQGKVENYYKYIMEAELLGSKVKQIKLEPNEIAVGGMMKADLYLRLNEMDKCIYILEQLHQSFAKNSKILLKLIKLYRLNNNYVNIIGLLPIIKKMQIYGSTAYMELEIFAYKNRLEQLTAGVIEENCGDLLIKFFKKIPKDLKNNREILLAYSSSLIKLKSFKLAEQILKNYLNDNNNDFDSNLIKLYGWLIMRHKGNLSSHLTLLEKWLQQHPSDPTLLLILGEVCIHSDLLGKAKKYLENSLNISDDPACYAQLGKLAEIMGDQIQSLHYYRQGLSMATKNCSLMC